MTATNRINRRTALRTLGAAGVALSAPAYLRAQSAATIKIGFVSPQTGPLGIFGETDLFALNRIRQFLGDGIELGGKTYTVDILDRDAESNPNLIWDIANDLIRKEQVQMVVPASTSEVAVPLARQAELYKVPCLSSASPWESVIFPLGGVNLDWSYHFFWGLGDVIGTFLNMWDSVDTNRKVGLLLPVGMEGDAWGDDQIGLPGALRAAGYTVVDVPRYELGSTDFTAQTAALKDAGCDIIGGFVFPDELKAASASFDAAGIHPKVMTIAAGLLFPGAVEYIGPVADHMSSEIWWTPDFPFQSSLTGESPSDIAGAWETETGRQWTQPLGYSHAMWEVIIDALRRAEDPMDRASLRDALKTTSLDTIVGPIQFGGEGGAHPNVATTPIVGGQWRKGEKWPFELSITENSAFPMIEAQSSLAPKTWG